MTKQEAIETIKLALSQVEWDYPLNYAAAFDMAIFAMEKQDAPDTNVDTISRQAAIDLFPDDALEWDTKGGYIAPHLARRMICELPSAQPEKLYTKADYIMALHKEYGCSLTRAEEAHNKALEYLQDKMMMKGEKND